MTDLERIFSTLRTRTSIPEGVKVNAAHEALTVYLDDWEAGYRLLGGRIQRLRQLRDERKADKEAGRWPVGGGGERAD